VRLLRGPWNKDFLDEIEVFPLGIHDVQVDAAADAFQKIGLGVVEPWEPTYDPEAQSIVSRAPEGVFMDERLKPPDARRISWPWS